MRELQAKRRIIALFESLNSHKSFHHLLNVAVKELANAALLESNVITFMDCGAVNVLISLLKDCSDHETIPLYALKVILALIQQPSSHESVCAILLQENFFQVCKGVLQPKGKPLPQTSTCETALSIFLFISKLSYDQAEQQGCLSLIFSVMENPCISGQMLQDCCELIIILSQCTDNQFVEVRNIRTVIACIENYEQLARENDGTVTSCILELLLCICKASDAARSVIRESCLSLLTSIFLHRHLNEDLEELGLSLVKTMLQKKNLFSVIPENITSIVNAVRIIRTPEFQRIPNYALYFSTIKAIDTIAVLTMFNDFAENIISHNGIIVISAACLAGSSADIVLSSIRAFLCLSTVQVGAYRDRLLEGGALKGLLHGIKLGLIKGMTEVLYLSIECIQRLACSTLFLPHMHSNDGFSVLSQLFQSHHEFQTAAKNGIHAISGFPAREYEVESPIPSQIFEDIAAIQICYSNNSDMQLACTKALSYIASNCNEEMFVLYTALKRQIIISLKNFGFRNDILKMQIQMFRQLMRVDSHRNALCDQGLLRLLAKALYLNDNMSILRSNTDTRELISLISNNAEMMRIMEQLDALSLQLRSSSEAEMELLIEEIEEACSTFGTIVHSPTLALSASNVVKVLGAMFRSTTGKISCGAQKKVLAALSYSFRELCIAITNTLNTGGALTDGSSITTYGLDIGVLNSLLKTLHIHPRDEQLSLLCLESLRHIIVLENDLLLEMADETAVSACITCFISNSENEKIVRSSLLVLRLLAQEESLVQQIVDAGGARHVSTWAVGYIKTCHIGEVTCMQYLLYLSMEVLRKLAGTSGVSNVIAKQGGTEALMAVLIYINNTIDKDPWSVSIRNSVSDTFTKIVSEKEVEKAVEQIKTYSAMDLASESSSNIDSVSESINFVRTVVLTRGMIPSLKESRCGQALMGICQRSYVLKDKSLNHLCLRLMSEAADILGQEELTWLLQETLSSIAQGSEEDSSLPDEVLLQSLIALKDICLLCDVVSAINVSLLLKCAEIHEGSYSIHRTVFEILSRAMAAGEIAVSLDDMIRCIHLYEKLEIQTIDSLQNQQAILSGVQLFAKYIESSFDNTKIAFKIVELVFENIEKMKLPSYQGFSDSNFSLILLKHCTNLLQKLSAHSMEMLKDILDHGTLRLMFLSALESSKIKSQNGKKIVKYFTVLFCSLMSQSEQFLKRFSYDDTYLLLSNAVNHHPFDYNFVQLCCSMLNYTEKYSGNAPTMNHLLMQLSKNSEDLLNMESAEIADGLDGFGNLDALLVEIYDDLKNICLRIYSTEKDKQLDKQNLQATFEVVVQNLNTLSGTVKRNSGATSSVFENVIKWSLYTLNRLVQSNIWPEKCVWDYTVEVINNSTRTLLSTCGYIMINFFGNCMNLHPKPLEVLSALIKYSWGTVTRLLLVSEAEAEIDWRNECFYDVERRNIEQNRLFKVIGSSLRASTGKLQVENEEIRVLVSSLKLFPLMQDAVMDSLLAVSNGIEVLLDISSDLKNTVIQDRIYKKLDDRRLPKNGNGLQLVQVEHTQAILTKLRKFKVSWEGKHMLHRYNLEIQGIIASLNILKRIVRNTEHADSLISAGGLQTILHFAREWLLPETVRDAVFSIFNEMSKQPTQLVVDAFIGTKAVDLLISICEYDIISKPEMQSELVSGQPHQSIFQIMLNFLSFLSAEETNFSISTLSSLKYLVSRIDGSPKVLDLGRHLVARIDSELTAAPRKSNFNFDEALDCVNRGSVWVQLYNSTKDQYYYENSSTGKSKSKKPSAYSSMEKAIAKTVMYLQSLKGLEFSSFENAFTDKRRLSLFTKSLCLILSLHTEATTSTVVLDAVSVLQSFCELNHSFMAEMMQGDIFLTLRKHSMSSGNEKISLSMTCCCLALSNAKCSESIVKEILETLQDVLSNPKSSYGILYISFSALMMLCKHPDVLTTTRIQSSNILTSLSILMEVWHDAPLMLRRICAVLKSLIICTNAGIGRKTYEICGEILLESILQTHVADEQLTFTVLSIIEVLCNTGMVAYEVLENDACAPGLAKVLTTHFVSESMMEIAINILLKISSLEIVGTENGEDRSPTSTLLSTENACSSLIQLLYQVSTSRLVLKCVKLLLNCMDDDANINILIQSQLTQGLLYIVQSFDWDIKIVDTCLKALSGIAYVESGRVEIEKANGISILLYVFDIHRHDSVEVVEGLVCCMTNLACSKRKLQGWDNSVVALIDIIKKSAQIVDQCTYLESVIGILARLSVESSMAHEICEKGLALMLDMLLYCNGRADVVLAILCLLQQLCFFSQNASQFMVLDGAAIVLEQLHFHFERGDVVEKCAQVLTAILEGNRIYVSVLRDAEAESLLNLIAAKYKKNHKVFHTVRKLLEILEESAVQGQNNLAASGAVLSKQQQQYETFIALLKRGGTFSVYEKGKLLSMEKSVTLSQDMKHFVLRDAALEEIVFDLHRVDASTANNDISPRKKNKNGRVKLLPLRKVEKVTYGLGSGHKRLFCRTNAVPAKCMNIISQDHVLSLECKTVLDRKRWGDAFSAIVKANKSESLQNVDKRFVTI